MGCPDVSLRKYRSLWAVYSTVTASHVTAVKVEFVITGATAYKPLCSLSYVRCQNSCSAPEMFPLLVEGQQF
jgi:hypothetical protein